MLDAPRAQIRVRSIALWCVTSAAAAGIGMVTAPTLAAGPHLLGPGSAFTDLLVAGCSAATLVATGWLWVITTDVVVRVLKADGDLVVRRPGPLRLLLLTVCGVVALSATAAPASADDRRPVAPPTLAGLPLPDRATGDAAQHRDRTPQEPPARIRVRPGDSLWAIAEQRLGPQASVVAVADYWHRIYDRNVSVIGPDPDLILPGQLLELPPTG